jgi:hypothetical protein
MEMGNKANILNIFYTKLEIIGIRKTPRMKIEDAFKYVANGSLKKIPKKHLTRKLLLESNPKEEDGYYINIPQTPLIVEIIHRGLVDQVPKGIFNINFVCTEVGPRGRTILMELAEGGSLKSAPKSSLSKKNVLKLDSLGNNVLYHSCRTGDVSLLPPNILNPKVLTKRNQRGRSPLHEAARHGNLGLIPKKLINEKTMLGQTPQKTDPIDELYIYIIGKEKNSTLIENILETYSREGLKYLEKKDLPLNCLATKELKQRRSKDFSKKLSGRSKDLKILD